MPIPALFLMLSLLSQASGDVPAPVMTTTITHVRVIDGTGRPPIENTTVVLRDGKIAAVGANVRAEGTVIDGRGKTLMPGIINAHGHLAMYDPAAADAAAGTLPPGSPDYYTREHALAELRQYERYGVTTMLSLGLNRDLIYQLRAEQRAGTVDGASVYVADRGNGVLNGAPPVNVAADQLYRPASPAEARADVDAAAGRHADFIKIWVDSLYHTKPTMDVAISTAVITEAHARQTPVAAHVFYLADAEELVNAGVNVLAHSVRDQPVTPELLDAMKAHGTYLIPTLTVDESFFAYADQPAWLTDPFFRAACTPALYATLTSPVYRDHMLFDDTTGHHRADHAAAEANLKLAFDAGVKIAFGTDSGAFASRVPGFAEHHEMVMMTESGLTPLQVIHAATETSAQMLGIDAETGTIEAGKAADMILLNANPLDDIHNTQQIAAIWHKGRVVVPVTAQ